MKNFHFKYTLKAFNSKFKMFHLISLMFSVRISEVMHCFINSIPLLYYSPLHSSQLYYNPQLSCVPESREISIINNICMSLQSQKLDFIQHLAFREANLTTRSRWNNISIFSSFTKTETTNMWIPFYEVYQERLCSWYKWRLLF